MREKDFCLLVYIFRRSQRIVKSLNVKYSQKKKVKGRWLIPTILVQGAEAALSIVDMAVDMLRAPRPQTHRKLAIWPGLEGM